MEQQLSEGVHFDISEDFTSAHDSRRYAGKAQEVPGQLEGPRLARKDHLVAVQLAVADWEGKTHSFRWWPKRAGDYVRSWISRGALQDALKARWDPSSVEPNSWRWQQMHPRRFDSRNDGSHRGELLQQAVEVVEGQRPPVLRDAPHLLRWREYWAAAIPVLYARDHEAAEGEEQAALYLHGKPDDQ